MAGGVQGAGLQFADLVAVAVMEQVIELAAVAGEVGAGVEHLAEGVLDGADVVADGELAAHLLLQPGGGG